MLPSAASLCGSCWFYLILTLLPIASPIGSHAAAATLQKSPQQLEQLELQQRMERHSVDKDGDGRAEEHDTSFDREMFLGREASRAFTGLRADEARTRLGHLFDTKIDTDKDGKASREELIAWMERVAEEHAMSELDDTWIRLKRSPGDHLTWAEYAASKLPGALPNADEKYFQAVLKALQASNPAEVAKTKTLVVPPLPEGSSEDAKSLMGSLVSDLVRESRRWITADGDKDSKLTKTELHHFYYPDDFPHMRDLLVQESLEHVDKNGDGKVSLEEFLTDMWSPTKDSDEKEPEWVEDERKSFREAKDKNKDGFLDRAEFTDYMFSHEQEKGELYKREAGHLITEADADKDGALNRKEIVGNLELFAGSTNQLWQPHWTQGRPLIYHWSLGSQRRKASSIGTSQSLRSSGSFIEYFCHMIPELSAG